MADDAREEGDQDRSSGLNFWKHTLRQVEGLLELAKLGVLRPAQPGAGKLNIAEYLRSIGLNGLGYNCYDEAIYSVQIDLMKKFHRMLQYNIIAENLTANSIRVWLNFAHLVLCNESTQGPETCVSWRRKKWAMKIVIRLVDTVRLATKRPTALVFETGDEILKQSFKDKRYQHTDSLGLHYRGRRAPVPEELTIPCIHRYVMYVDCEIDTVYHFLLESLKESTSSVESNEIFQMLSDCRDGRLIGDWCKFTTADSLVELKKISARLDLFHCVLDLYPEHRTSLLDEAEKLSKSTSGPDRAALIAMMSILNQREELQDNERLQCLQKELTSSLSLDRKLLAADPDTWQARQVVLCEMLRDINNRLEEKEFIDLIRPKASELLTQFYEHEQNDIAGHVLDFQDFNSTVADLIKAVGDTDMLQRLFAAMSKAIARGRPVESTLEPIEIYLRGNPSQEPFFTCLFEHWRSLAYDKKIGGSKSHDLATDSFTNLLTKSLWVFNSCSSDVSRIRSIIKSVEYLLESDVHPVDDAQYNLLIAVFATCFEQLHEEHDHSDRMIQLLTYRIIDRDYATLGGDAPMPEKFKMITLLLLKLLSLSNFKPVDSFAIMCQLECSLEAILCDEDKRDLAIYVFESIEKANPEWYYHVKTSLDAESQELLEKIRQ